MSEKESGHSRELDEVRRVLFPFLSREEGWARIDRSIREAANDERWAPIEEAAKQERLSDAEWAAIEEAARQQDLGADLLERLSRLRKNDRE